MSAGKQFVLDANVFIQAHQMYYGFEICPGFWRALTREHDAKRIVSIDKVRTELLAIKDQLSTWARNTAPATFFKGTANKAVSAAFRDMINWVQGQKQFTLEAKAQFASAADGWVIAYAKAYGHIVVTHEEYAPDARKKVPMPNVCREFNVEYRNTFAMLKELKVKFGLEKRK